MKSRKNQSGFCTLVALLLHSSKSARVQECVHVHVVALLFCTVVKSAERVQSCNALLHSYSNMQNTNRNKSVMCSSA